MNTSMTKKKYLNALIKYIMVQNLFRYSCEKKKKWKFIYGFSYRFSKDNNFTILFHFFHNQDGEFISLFK